MPTNSTDNSTWTTTNWTDNSEFRINLEEYKTFTTKVKAKKSEVVTDKEGKRSVKIRCEWCDNVYEYDPDAKEHDPRFCSVKCRLEGKYNHSSLNPRLFTEEGMNE